MRSIQSLLAIALATPMLATPLAASAAQLDVKTGQWEITSLMHVDGAFISPDMLAKLPPQAQVQMQAMMQNLTKPHTAKSCITDDDLRNGLNLNTKMSPTCKRSVQSVTAGGMDVLTECQTPNGTSTVHAKFTAADRSTIQGLVNIDRTSPQGPKHMTVNIDGKWLADACDGTEVHKPTMAH